MFHEVRVFSEPDGVRQAEGHSKPVLEGSSLTTRRNHQPFLTPIIRCRTHSHGGQAHKCEQAIF